MVLNAGLVIFIFDLRLSEYFKHQTNCKQFVNVLSNLTERVNIIQMSRAMQ